MPELAFVDIAEYQNDAVASLQLYFSQQNPLYGIRFFDYLPSEVASELLGRLEEADMRSVLIIAARLEASFRVDFKSRIQEKKSDPVSIVFRKIHKRRGYRVPLDDILEIWRENIGDPIARSLISKFRGVLLFRHWLAHGRYWQIGNKFEFQDIYFLAESILKNFPLLS